VKLYPYQREAVRFIEQRDYKAGLFAEMGTGKTPISLSVIARSRAKRVLVVCSLSATNVWRNEIRKIGAPWDVLTLNSGSLEKRAERLIRVKRDDSRVRIVIVNYDIFWRHPDEYKVIKGKSKHFPVRGLRKAILKFDPEFIVADEAHHLAHHTTKQSKFAHTLAEKAWGRIAPTGTPIERIEDLFSLYRFIDPQVFGTSYSDFERRYIIRGGYGGYQIVGYRNKHEIERKIAKTAYQVNIDDVLNLPEPFPPQVVPIDLEAPGRRAYNMMRKEALVELEMPGRDGQPLRGRALTSIVLTALTRLQQIAGGALPVTVESTSDGPDEVRIAHLGDEKLNAAVELTQIALSENRSVVIFARFIDEVRRLQGAFPHHFADNDGICFFCHKKQAARGHLPPFKESFVGRISGNVAPNKRQAIIDALNRGDKKVLIVQIQSGNEAIDLTAASVAIFYSTGYSLREFTQARARLYRHGQKRRINEYFLQVVDSIDEDILEDLMSKRDVARSVTRLNYARELISGRKKRRRK